MGGSSRQPWVLVLGATVVIIAVTALAWLVVPADLHGSLLLVGAVCTAVMYVALWAVQRRAHWGS